MTFGSASFGVGAIEPGSYVMAFDPARTRPQNKTQHDGAGYGTLYTVVRFVAWATEQQHFPMHEQVMARFNCSRATAHRWLNALADAYGVDRPRRDALGRIREVVSQ